MNEAFVLSVPIVPGVGCENRWCITAQGCALYQLTVPLPEKEALLMECFFFLERMGFERPLRKHAGGMFLGRGRIHGKSMASRKGCQRHFIFRYILQKYEIPDLIQFQVWYFFFMLE